ncbi:MAG: flagellar FliJ protein [Desulfobacteraceae bacterium Eth-SRB1]|nr:MAG: flagellar FliJ protein [Desulfobacteraceae bacterium Eth-SRB1]
MFNFRLQPVLKYRKQLEERIMLEFADKKRNLACEKETLEKLRKGTADLISRLEKMGESKLSAADASIYLSYISHMKDEENYREKIICQIGKELEEKRTKLVNASRKRRILEIVKEKKLKEYRSSLTKGEQKELDEAGIFRTGFRDRGSWVNS